MRCQQFNQSFGCPSCALKFAPNLGEGGNGTGNHDRVNHELHQFTDRDDARLNVRRPHPQEAHDGAEGHENNNRRQDGTGRDTLSRGVKAVFGDAVKMAAANAFMGECLNRLRAKQLFGRIARRLRDPVLIFLAELANASPQNDDRKNNDRDRPEHHQGHLYGCEQHQPDATHQNQSIAQCN